MRVWILALAGVVLMSGCLTYQAGAPAGKIDVIAHRGASAYAPENTLAAFERAVALNAHWFELDCTLTRDGEVLVIHDDTVNRTTGHRGRVRDMSMDELLALDAGMWFSNEFATERLPTLAESLDLGKGRIGVYIEIKGMGDNSALMEEILTLAQGHDRLYPRLRDETMALIEASGTPELELTRKSIAAVRERWMRGQIVIQSFSPIICAIALAEAPEMRTELLASSDNRRPERWTQYLRWLELLDAPGFNINKKDVTPELIAQVHEAGRTIAVWTVDDEGEMAELARMGVDAIITNKPDLCLDLLHRMGK